MRVTINKVDNIVTVNGESYHVPCDSLPSAVRVVQWYGSAGEVEHHRDGEGNFVPNKPIKDFKAYGKIIDGWQAAKEEAARKAAEAEAAFEEQKRKVAERQAQMQAAAEAVQNKD